MQQQSVILTAVEWIAVISVIGLLVAVVKMLVGKQTKQFEERLANNERVVIEIKDNYIDRFEEVKDLIANSNSEMKDSISNSESALKDSAVFKGELLKNADSTTLKNGLLKNADSTTIKTGLTGILLPKSDTVNQIRKYTTPISGTDTLATKAYARSMSGGGGGSSTTTVRLTSDFTTASTSFVGVTGLILSVSANTTYLIYGMIKSFSGGSQFTYPTGANFYAAASGWTSVFDFTQTFTNVQMDYISGASPFVVGMTGGTYALICNFSGILIVGSTAGDFSFQIKKGDFGICHAGSWMNLQATP